LGGIAVVVLAVVIAILGGKIHRTRSTHGELPADSSRVNNYTATDDYNWNEYDDNAAAGAISPSHNSSDAHSITITGINGITGNTTISVYEDDGSWVAHGTNTFWGDTAEYSLYDSGNR
jgi:hypothetical protein